MLKCLAYTLTILLALNSTSNADRIHGKVVDSKTGNPVEGIIVQAEHHENRNSDNPDDFKMRGLTGPDGLFSMELPVGSQEYMVFISDSKGHVYDGFSHLKGDNDLGTIEINKGGSLSGKVLNAVGKPVAQVDVVAQIRLKKYTCKHYVEAVRVQSDKDGLFEFTDLSPADYMIQVTPSSSSASYAPADNLITVSDEFNYVEFVLKNGCIVKGAVTGPDGKPLSGVRVKVGSKNSSVTGEDGKYILKGLSEGANKITFLSGGGYAAPGNQSIAVTCSADKEVERNIQLVKTGHLKLELKTESADTKLPSSVKIDLKKAGAWDRLYSNLSSDVKDGIASFRDIAPGKYDIAASGTGMSELFASVTIESGKESSADITVVKLYELKGSVVDDEGKAAEKIRVSIHQKKTTRMQGGGSRTEHINSHSGDTNAKGDFAFKGLPAGKFEVSIEAEGWMPITETVMIEPEAMARPKYALKKGLKISGSIVNADGTPVSGMEITVRGESRNLGGSSIYKRIKPEADGTFEVGGLAGGGYTLEVKDESLGMVESEMKNVQAGSDEIIITLARQYSVKGTVADQAGSPLAGAGIEVTKVAENSFYSRSWSSDDKGISTDAKGNFTVNLREGSKYKITASRHPYLSASRIVDCTDGSAEKTGPVKIVMDKGQVISGVVTREIDSKPAAGLIVLIMDASNMYNRRADNKEKRAVTDSSGKFVLEGAPLGSVSIGVFNENADNNYDNESMIAVKSVTIKKDTVPDPVTITLRENLSYRGIVTDKKGKPLSGVSVKSRVSLKTMTGPRSYSTSYLNQQDTQTAADGSFTLDNISSDKFDLEISHDDFMEIKKTITVDKANMSSSFVMEKGASICGSIIEADGSPASGIRINIYGPSGATGDSHVFKDSELDEKGAFEVHNLSPGKYQLDAYEASGSKKILSMNSVAAGSEDIIINLAREIKVSGVVTGPDGKILSGVAVRSGMADNSFFPGNAEPDVVTDASGKFELQLREGNKYRIIATQKPFLPASANIDLTAEGKPPSDPIKLVLEKGYTVKGKVVSSKDSTPLANVFVRALQPGAMGIYMYSRNEDADAIRTDSAGRFQLVGVPVGLNNIMIMTGEDNSKVIAEKKIVVKAGEANDVTISVGGCGGVKGTLVLEDGVSPADCQVIMYSPTSSGRNYNAQVGDDGKFEIKDAAPGKYMMMWMSSASGRSPSANNMKNVVIKEGETTEITLGSEKPPAGSITISGTVQKQGVPVKDSILYMILVPGKITESSLVALYGSVKQSQIDSDSKFAIENIQPGKYIYMVQAGDGRQSGRPEMFHGYTQVEKATDKFVINAQGLTITGKVLGADGKPLTGATVSATPVNANILELTMMVNSAVTDENGMYRIKCLSPRAYTMRVEHEHGSIVPKNISVTVDSQVIDFEVAAGFTLSGNITRDGDKECQGAQAALFLPDAMEYMQFVMSNIDGSFKFNKPVPVGKYILFVSVDGYSSDVREITIDKNIEKLGVNLVPAGSIRVQLKSGPGKDIKDRCINITTSNGKPVIRSRNQLFAFSAFRRQGFGLADTNEEGTTLITGLVPGSYTVFVDGIGKKTTVNVKMLEETLAEIQL